MKTRILQAPFTKAVLAVGLFAGGCVSQTQPASPDNLGDLRAVESFHKYAVKHFSKKGIGLTYRGNLTVGWDVSGSWGSSRQAGRWIAEELSATTYSGELSALRRPDAVIRLVRSGGNCRVKFDDSYLKFVVEVYENSDNPRAGEIVELLKFSINNMVIAPLD